MIKVIIREKETNNYIGIIEVYRDEIRTLEQEFIVIEK